MSDAIEKAKELGQAIIESEEYKDYQRYKLILEEKGVINKALSFEKANAVINSGKYNENDKVFKDAKEIVKSCENLNEVKDYVSSKQKLNQLLSAVNGTLAHITGMEAGDNACGGCGGCSKLN